MPSAPPTRATASSPRRAATTSPVPATRRRPASAGHGSIDPLDGTINYANGIPFFCVSIAARRGGPARRRGHPRPDARRDVRRLRRRAGDARRAADRGIDQGPPLRLRRVDVPLRPGRSSAAPGTFARRSGSRARWAPPRWRSRTWATAASTRSSSRAACRRGTSRPPASSPSAAAPRSRTSPAAPGSRSPGSRGPSVSSPPRGPATPSCCGYPREAAGERELGVLAPAVRPAPYCGRPHSLRTPPSRRGPRPANAGRRRRAAGWDAVVGRAEARERAVQLRPRPSARGAWRRARRRRGGS